uniref:Ribosomal protein S14 n=1 Tax=Balanophora reflexa TaxID=533299 RepID=A0A451GIM2_9MAGN
MIKFYNNKIIFIYYFKKIYKYKKNKKQYCYITKKKRSILKNFLLSRYIIRIIINKYLLLSGFKKYYW